MDPAELLACVFASWSPRIGDPSIMGWVTVAAYLVAAGLAAAAARTSEGRVGIFWLALSLLLLALAVNKQLDLQSALTAAGRCAARAQGWYDDRGKVQVRFILAVMVAGATITVAGLLLMRRHLSETWPAVLGLGALMTFIVVRAAGFHHFDRFIGSEIGGVRMNWLLELGGIGLIAANAAFAAARRPGRTLATPVRGVRTRSSE